LKLRYIGTRGFKLHIGDVVHDLKEGDVVDFEPWKIRSSRLTTLFEVAEDDPDKLTKEEKKFLKSLSTKRFADPSLYTKKEKVLTELQAELKRRAELEKEKNKT